MNLRAIVTSLPLLANLLLPVLTGCHHEPAPDYPVHEDPPLEETDLYEYTDVPEGTATADAGDSE